jgi:hypothetical protein
MVRFRDAPAGSSGSAAARYADWMGSRHMSAADTSARPDVVTTITLSAENGRVTRFRDGEYRTTPYGELRRAWQ